MKQSEKICRHNVMRISSPDEFLRIKGGWNHGVKDVYFVRVLGRYDGYEQKIRAMDYEMEEEKKNGHLFYTRFDNLSGMVMTNAWTEFCASAYDCLLRGEPVNFIKNRKEDCLNARITDALREVGELYRVEKKASVSMVRNFSVKILVWLNTIIAEECFQAWEEKKQIKIIAINITKLQEYLFFYFLTILGCDVLLLETEGDIYVSEELKKLSQSIKVGEYGKLEVPESVKTDFAGKKEEKRTREKDAKKRLERPAERGAIERSSKPLPREKNFEELAQLASSIVMIAVHKQDGEVVGTGSGIMIGTGGFILTNYHVIEGGKYYSVRIEDDENVYTTNELIKYHPALDLAIIRIERVLQPLPVYHGREKLVRGQKVVAIGSPLGLFNSVSDGIISGFRKIDGIDMIQFTAPVSPGSSGGAVLNMQGQVIGISTAGISKGQNLNLAVGYENILPFAGGFCLHD